MPSNFRFGPFAVDAAAYRLLKDGTPLDLSPKALDLLQLFASRPGTLVTKDEMLAALWPGIAVTDNAITQVVSELRQALGDSPSSPHYIETVPRRGYRFIAEIVSEGPAGEASPKPEAKAGPKSSADPKSPGGARSVVVADFANVAGDSEMSWLSAGIAETVTNDLRAIRDLRVIDRTAGPRMAGDPTAIGAGLDAAHAAGLDLVVLGSFQRAGDRLRITARAVDVRSRETLAQAKSDGPVADVFALQDAIVTQLSSGLALTVTPAAAVRINARETSSLEAYRALTLGRLKLEALDLAEVPGAIADFERALQLDPDYALAHVGLAHARFWKFQASRARLRPDRDELAAAIAHARRAVEIDPELAEGHAALAFFLSSADRGREAVAAGRVAVALEPGNWRHQFRLGVAAWGDERVQCLQTVTAQFPALAYAYLALAMTHVARNDLATARAILSRGLTFESAPATQGRFPGRGLHWLVGLIDLAAGDLPAARREFEAELASRAAAVYDDEFTMDACAGLGYTHLADGDASAAAASFERGLERVPDHARLVVGLSESAARLKQRDRAKELLARAGHSVDTLVSEGRTFEAAMSRACWLVASGRPDDAIGELGTLLDSAPAGSAGWTMPIEPGLAALRGSPRFKRLLARLADRAR